MSKKKKVTAPLTYDPGKGRPKEYLAYLNYQEMQALKRLNGNNQERGPRGLPSFPPAGAMSGGSAKSPASTSKEAGAGSRPSSGGPRSGERGSVSPSSGSPRGSNPPGAGGSDSGSRPSVGSRPSGGMMGGTGAGGSSRTTPSRASSDREAIDAVNKANSSIAKTTPALKSDLSRSVSAKPMGASVGVNFPTGGRISGAIKSLQTPAAPLNQNVSRGVTVPAATMTTQQMKNLYSQYQQPPSPPPTEKQIAQKLREAYPDRWGRLTVDEAAATVKTLAEALPGEADINRYSAGSMRNLAQVGINQVNRNITPENMLKAIDTTGLDAKRGTQSLAMPGPSSMGMTRNWADQNLARQSYNTALRSIESAVENKGVATQARNATNFVAEGTPMVRGVKSIGDPVEGTQFGIDPAGRAAVAKRNRIADMKRDYSQYRTPGADVRVVPASASLERGNIPNQRPASDVVTRVPPDERYRVPPDERSIMNRPDVAQGSILRRDRFGEPILREKQFQDRINVTPSNEQSLYTGRQVSASPSQESAPPSQDFTITEEAELAQDAARKRAGQVRKGTQVVLNSVAAPLGTVVGEGLKALDARTQKLVDAYQVAGMSERKVMEEKYPNLIARANEMGINSYYGMDRYNSWAEKSGLRGAPDRRGGGENSGILSLTRQPKGDETTTPEPEAPSTSSGSRPDIYYMWDLGINIPSPGDPNYTQYQTYLAERLAAQRAMGYV